MSATIFWRRDEPDDSQVKEVNVPGVFPRPSTAVHGRKVTASARPWLQAKKVNQTPEPSRAGARLPEEKLQRGELEEQVTMKGSKKKITISLKDLGSEDKRRVANLIKELAKVGEERKLAINALHKERIDFQGKEGVLKQEQEKLVMERDELREKMLEYQFLINQYSKQMQHKDLSSGKVNGSFIKPLDVKDKHHESKISKEPSNFDFPENLREAIILKDPTEKIPTYYSVTGHEKEVTVGESHSHSHPKNLGRELPTPSPSKKYILKGSESCLKIGPDLSTDVLKCSMCDVSAPEACDELSEQRKPDFGAQSKLLDQQNALLEQQKCIQEQLEGLKELHKKYLEDIAHITIEQRSPTHFEKEVDSCSKVVPQTIASKDVAVCTKDNHTVSQAVQCDIEILESIKEKTPNAEPAQNEKKFLEASMKTKGPHPAEQNSKSNDFKVDFGMLASPLHDVQDELPAFFFHKRDSLESNEAKKLKLLQNFPVTTDLKHLQKTETSSSFQEKPNITKKGRPNPGSWEFNRFEDISANSDADFAKTIIPRSSSRRHRKRYYDVFDSDESSAKDSSRKSFYSPNLDRKQSSLLNILEEIDQTSFKSKEVQDSFELGSYLGFAENIMQAKSNNERIFASTDQSDTESEQDENKLLSDVFYLQKF